MFLLDTLRQSWSRLGNEKKKKKPPSTLLRLWLPRPGLHGRRAHVQNRHSLYYPYPCATFRSLGSCAVTRSAIVQPLCFVLFSFCFVLFPFLSFLFFFISFPFSARRSALQFNGDERRSRLYIQYVSNYRFRMPRRPLPGPRHTVWVCAGERYTATSGGSFGTVRLAGWYPSGHAAASVRLCAQLDPIRRARRRSVLRLVLRLRTREHSAVGP